jgi:hypothetical protein
MYADKPEGELLNRHQGEKEGFFPTNMSCSSNEKGTFDRAEDTQNFNKVTKPNAALEKIQEHFEPQLRQNQSDTISGFADNASKALNQLL